MDHAFVREIECLGIEVSFLCGCAALCREGAGPTPEDDVIARNWCERHAVEE